MAISRAIQQLKQLHPQLKVLMSIGGASAANTAAFATAAGSAAGRQALASSCIDMFVKGNIAAGVTAPGLFDGFNIDWEFPAAGRHPELHRAAQGVPDAA